jgi:hypothetical protein
MNTCSWDFEKKHAFRIIDGVRQETSQIFPIEIFKKDMSPVGARFEDGEARVMMIWWGAVQPVMQTGIPTGVYRKIKVIMSTTNQHARGNMHRT